MESLTSVCIFEKDSNNDLLRVWSYPIVERNIENSFSDFIKNEKNLKSGYFYTKIENVWRYFNSVTDSINNTVKSFTIVISSNEMDSEKYLQLSNLFLTLYKESLDPIKILLPYLSLFGSGKYQDFKNSDFDPR